jgi:hypothetical protein
MFVATDWYYISRQNGGGSGLAPGDPLTVFPALGVAFLGISLPLLLQGSEKYKTRVKVAVNLLISLSVVSATFVGLTLYTPPPIWGPNPPVSPKEALNMMSYTVNSPTNVTLKIINAGPSTVYLVAYFVKNPNGQWYNNTQWLGPTFSPNAIATVNFPIDGNTFTFQSGYSYTVFVVTSRNNLIGFPIKA